MHHRVSRSLLLALFAGVPVAMGDPSDFLNPPDPAADMPDIGFNDSNADGIDGMACGPIFVDTLTGLDSNLGDMNAPMKTVGAAILAAASFSPARDVYVSMGTYNETIVLQADVDIFGGYDAALGWTRSAANTVHIVGDVVAMYAQDLPQPVTVDLVTIQSDNASAAGQDSIAVLVRNAPNGVVFSNSEIVPGDGGAGQSGANGASGSPGNRGSNGASGRKDDYDYRPNGGSGGSSPVGNTGGRGGNGGYDGTSGNGQNGGGGVGPGGNGGSGNGNNGDPGGDGGHGGNGSNGSTGSSGANSTGFYSVGSTGGSGSHGGGGGGGGGGAAQTGLFVTNGSGNAGGGGGGGGRGGFGGAGGVWGGSSYGILTLSADVTIDNAVFMTGNGGVGGNGGNGGNGGAGGGRGLGGTADLSQIGEGGDGGLGGRGGNGGKGGGGVGGNTIGVFAAGAAPGNVSDISSTFLLGIAGPGGIGGSAAPSGLEVETHTGAITPPTIPSLLPPTVTHSRIYTNAGEVSTATPATTSDPDAGDMHAIALTGQPNNGLVAVVNNELVYAPNPGFTGVDFFGYESTDQQGNTVPGFAVVYVNSATECIADLDGDGMVTGSDLSALLAAWGTCP